MLICNVGIASRVFAAFFCLMIAQPALSAADQANAPYVVAFAQDTLKNDFRRAQVFAVKERLEQQPDIRFLFSDAKGKTALLIHQIDGFIRQQVDVLIVGTNDAELVVPVIEKAHRQGIHTLVLDRGVATREYTSFLSSDNVLIGEMAGRFIADRVPQNARVLLLEGLQSADVTHHRSEGFLNIMKTRPDIELERRTGNYLRRDALVAMEQLLAEGFHPDAIFSGSDSMLSGVRAVLSRHGIDPGSILTVGVDYTSEARQAILAGDQTASVLFPLGAAATADAVIRLRDGDTLPKHIRIPVETLVTRDNAELIQPVF